MAASPVRPDYARLDYEHRQHHARFKAYVKAHGLLCQACGGFGQSPAYTTIYSAEPPEPCGWCETTGKTTRWLRGMWLRFCRDEKRARRKVS